MKPVAVLRAGWERLSIYLPVILMGLLALGTYWLASNTPIFSAPEAEKAERHEPDYFMRKFEVKTFDASGRLKSEVFGAEARHYPDTDTLEIDKARIRSFAEDGRLTVATAERALSNGDGSEVQLSGNAVVVRDAAVDASGKPVPRFVVRGEFLHVFMNTERIKSHLPVVMTRGSDEFAGDSMEFDNLDRVMNLQGRVRGYLAPRPPKN
ncbi:MAG: LPS export ABC transporter periplasmic protein LptC [Pseudomonadota bacterium]